MVWLEYKRAKSLPLFFELKPKLTGKQANLLSAFYSMGQDRQYMNGAPLPIKSADIREHQKHNGSCGYAGDLFEMAIKTIDQEYVTHKCEEIKRKMNKGK